MATKAELQAALNQARDEINVLKCQLNTAEAERPQSSPKAILPWDDLPTRRQVMAAAKAQAMATGRTVLVA